MKVFGDTKQIKKSVNSNTQNMNMIVDEKAFSILIDKLYSNKKFAIMREIASNAVDAHLAAGIDKPFDVTLPSMTSKELIIRDYGDGLSYDDCYYYLGTIFGSKSQNADNLIGGFGLGSKSPFCLVSSYHITSRHKGLEHKFLYLREQNGIPQFIHLYSEETDKPSGLEFVIDVSSDSRGWVDVAVRNLSFFDIKPNFVNNETIELIKPVELSEYLWYVDSHSNMFSDVHMVSMGGVVYSIPDYDYRNIINNGISHCKVKRGYGSVMILKFDIGELDISPSREHIEMTDKTKKAIVAKVEKLKNSGLAETIKETFINNINEHGYVNGHGMGLAAFYDGAYRPEIFTENDILQYPKIDSIINRLKSASVYDLCSILGITSYKDHAIFKSYTNNYYDVGNGGRTASAFQTHKKAIINDLRMSRMVIANQVEGGLLVVKPKQDTILETTFILDKMLSYLHKDDYTIELASEMNLKKATRKSSGVGVDSSGFITGIRTYGKDKVYEDDISDEYDHIYIECDGSYNALKMSEKFIINIMMNDSDDDSDYSDILPESVKMKHKRVLLVTTATIKKMKIESLDNWFTYDEIRDRILKSEIFIKDTAKSTVYSISKKYGIYRGHKILIDDDTVECYKKYITEFNVGNINRIIGSDEDDDKILISDVMNLDVDSDNPFDIKKVIMDSAFTISKKATIDSITKIISSMTTKEVLYYMDGNYSLLEC